MSPAKVWLEGVSGSVAVSASCGGCQNQRSMCRSVANPSWSKLRSISWCAACRYHSLSG